MPLTYLLDEHLRGRLWHALTQRNVGSQQPVDVVRVGDPADLALGSKDPAILLWAEGETRIFVSLDRRTLSGHLADHLAAGRHSPGIFIIRKRAFWLEVIDFLFLAAHTSDPYEWQDRIEFIG
jgi:hypothetical protein